MADIKLKKRYKYAGDVFKKLIDIGFDVKTATAFLNEVKDADIEEVKHAEWRSVMGDVIFACSNCDSEVSTSWDYENDDMFDYCPCCGAKMNGERKNENE